MNSNEVMTLRMNILGGFDNYIRNVIGDDDITDAWNIEGIPDGADEIDFMEIAENDAEWARICSVFGGLIN